MSESEKTPYESNPDSSTTIVRDKKVRGFNFTPAVVLVVIAVLMALTFYLYLDTAGEQAVLPESDLVEETVSSEEIDINQLAAERLAEVDQGQGLVDMYVEQDIQFFLTTPEGQTLYHRIEGFCEGECLNDWLPYSSTEPFEGDRLRSVLVNEEYNLHYVLLDNQMLFTYVGHDTEGDTSGEGIDGVWTLARP